MAFSLVVVPELPTWPFGVLRVAEIALAAVALGFLLATRERPTVRAALVYSAAAILPDVAMVLPESAHVGRGHPSNGFVMPQLLIACVALVVPRYFWLGAAVLSVFTVEALGVYAYVVHAALPELRLSAEPFFSLMFALVGFSLLVMREQRRALAVKHIQAQSEVMALDRIGPLFARVRVGLKDCVDAVSSELPRMRDSSTVGPNRRREIAAHGGEARYAQRQPDQLDPEAAARTFAEPLAAGVSFATAEAERSLYARDAHIGATVLATLMGLMAFLFIRANPLGRKGSRSDC